MSSFIFIPFCLRWVLAGNIILDYCRGQSFGGRLCHATRKLVEANEPSSAKGK